MKTTLRLIMLLLAVTLFLPSFAQVPQKMNYQAVARNSSGNPITNHAIGVKFTIREGSASGPDIFAETMTANTNSLGTFSVEIGGGTAVLGSFATIPWSTGAKYLNIKIDPAGGTSYTDMGTFQLLSVAYAQYAKNVLNNDDADASPTNELQTLSIAGNQLSISNGNTVTVPGGSGGGTPGGATGNVQFNNAGAFAGDNAFFWDNSLKNLGVGTMTPAYPIDVLHGGSTGLRVKSSASFSVIDIDAFTGDAALRFASNGVNQWNVRNRPADNYLEFFELGGGGSRMVIQDGTGNVGIGETTSPSYKLDVLHGGSTGLRVRSSASFSVIDIDAFSGDAALRFANNGVNQWNLRNEPGTDNLQIFELGGGGERLRIENTSGNVIVPGKLGVGTTAAATLGGITEISGNSTTGSPQLLLTETEAEFARIGFKNTTANKTFHIAGNCQSADANSNLNFWYYNGTAGTDLVTMAGDGRITMRTPAAGNDHILDLFGYSSHSYAAFHNDATGYTNSDGMKVGSRSDGTAFIWNYENLPINFGTNGATRLTIGSDGNVGIGTSSPTAMLDVYGSAKVGASGTVFSEVREITGTTGASGSYTQIAFPSGYTMANTRILSCEINYSGTAWVGLGGTSDPSGATSHVFYYMNSSYIWLYYAATATFQNRAYRILLMKM